MITLKIEEIAFYCEDFEDAVRQKLEIYDRPITSADALALEELDCSEFTFFDDPEVFRFFPNLKDFAICVGASGLYGLKYLTKLESLFVEAYGYEVDYQIFADMSELVDLMVSGGDLSGINFINVTTLCALKKLRKLSFHEFGSVDLSFLSCMPQLEVFFCGWAKNIRNPEHIADLPKLKILSLPGNQKTDWRFLDKLSLDIELEFSSEINEIEDIARLKRFPHSDIYEIMLNGQYVLWDDEAKNERTI